MPRQHIIVLAVVCEADQLLLRSLFQPENGWTLLVTQDRDELLTIAKQYGSTVDICVIDISLLDGAGLQAAQTFQCNDCVNCTPLVILKQQDDAFDARIPEDLYVSEMLTSPMDAKVALRRINNILQLHAYQKKDINFQHTIPWDPLLGLLSGNAIRKAVNASLEKNENQALLFINIDNMKAINSQSGHHFGDLVLLHVAETLKRNLPESAVIGRPYGDTFSVLMPCAGDRSETIRFFEQLKASIRHACPFAPGVPITTTACVGVAMSPEDGKNYDALMEAAETANSIAKRMGKNILIFYSVSMSQAKPSIFHSHAMNELPNIPLHGRFMPMIYSEDQVVHGFTYYSILSEGTAKLHTYTVEQLLAMPSITYISLFRIDVRQLFSSMNKLSQEGITLPSVSFNTVLRGEQADILPLALHEALTMHPFPASCVCVNIPQEMVFELSSSRLSTLFQEIRALGFHVGIHNVGTRSIANACFEAHLFDRVTLAECFTADLFDNLYPNQVMENVISAIANEHTAIVFPTSMSQATFAATAKTLKTGFYSFSGPSLTEEAYRSLIQVQNFGPMPVATIKQRFSFRIGPEQYTEMFEKSGIVMFDWRPHDDMILFSESFEAIHGFPVNQLRLEGTLFRRVVHPDDYQHFRDALQQVKYGQAYSEGIIRMIRLLNGGTFYQWRRFSLVAVTNHIGIVEHVFGLIFDIDRERRELQLFQRRAEMDPLTQLYNRGATEQYIIRFLSNEGQGGNHAMLLLDIDDFKQINDTYGHTSGDEVLQHVAASLRSLFRSGDIIGRIGGDEFVIFLKNIDSETLIATRADSIGEMFHQADVPWKISGSVGVARYPKDGDTFQTLYVCADHALYQSKKDGKDRWAFSHKEILE